jgi:hypothetical protein
LDRENLKSHKEIIKAAAEKHGMDAVLITHLVGVEKKQIYHPPTYDPFPVGHHQLGSYYYGVYEYTHTRVLF